MSNDPVRSSDQHHSRLTITGVINWAYGRSDLTEDEKELIKSIGSRGANLILKEEGFLVGEPGNWSVTKEGMSVGMEQRQRVTDDGEPYNLILYNNVAQHMVVSKLLKDKRLAEQPIAGGESSRRDRRTASKSERREARRGELGLMLDFRRKWDRRLIVSERVIKHLTNGSDEDFFGALVVFDADDPVIDPFFRDLCELLHDLNKIDDVTPVGAMELMNSYDEGSGEFDIDGYRGSDLPPRRLVVLGKEFLAYDPDLAGDDADPKANQAQYQHMLNALTHELQDRYAIAVGKEDEIERLCRRRERFAKSFGENTLRLAEDQIDTTVETYMLELKAEVAQKIEDPEAFRLKLKRHIAFNKEKQRETLSYRYAMDLADHSNAVGKPVLKVPKGGYDEDELQKALDSVVGLKAVKRALLELRDEAYFNKLARKRVQPGCKHMMFVGNPGTGKTMMARIFARFLPLLGVIKIDEGEEPKFTEVTSQDIIESLVGQSERNMAKCLQESRGGVLFIDEAYSLLGHVGTNSDVSAGVIAELVKGLDEYKDDLIVIFAGYEERMTRFIESNPGLRSRIPYTFRFEDYSTSELMELFGLFAREEGFVYDEESVDNELRALFNRNRRFTDFGNVRFVRNVLSMALRRHAVDTANRNAPSDELLVLNQNDIPSQNDLMGISDWSYKSAKDMFEGVVGLEDIKEVVYRFEKEVRYRKDAQRLGMRLPDKRMHMILTGNPGTGKTTVARILGKVLYNVGMLPTSKFIEVDGSMLSKSGSYGESVVGTYIRDAMGGVLFIDEAYSLLSVRDGEEIIAKLVKAMEDHRNDFVVIFAGYEEEMRQFSSRNPGLESRIGYTLHFADYSVEELLDIFNAKASSVGFSLSDDAVLKARDVLRYFHRVKRFGNGRFVDKLLEETISLRASRYVEDDEHGDAMGDGESDCNAINRLVAEDIPSIGHMIRIVAVPVVWVLGERSQEEERRLATHEIGHVICRLGLGRGLDIMSVTLEAEGDGAAAHVLSRVTKLPSTKSDLDDELAILLGGMAAEECVFGTPGLGSRDDLKKATNIAYEYTTRMGLSNAGLVFYYGMPLQDLPSEVRSAIRDVLDKSFARAKALITQHRHVLDALVDELCQRKSMDGQRLREVWEEHQSPSLLPEE